MAGLSPALLQAIAKGDPRDPAGFPIDINRPALQNPDGSYSTEKTITVGFGDRYYNIPTIWDGVELPSDGAVLMAKDALRRGVQFPNFRSLTEAVTAAPLRSQAVDKARRQK